MRNAPWQGGLMGLADSVPGVSGGTVAYILGIHPRLVAAIAAVSRIPGRLRDKDPWADISRGSDLPFLALLGLGLMVGLVVGAKLLVHLIGTEPTASMAILLGLVAVSVWLPASRIEWGGRAIAWCTAAVLVALILTVGWDIRAPATWWFLPIAGAIAVCAMILPGISGAYLLLIMGLYTHVLEAVAHLDLAIIALVGAGAAIGLLAFSRGLDHALTQWHDAAHAVLTGLLLGSLGRLWPWRTEAGFAEGLPAAPDTAVPILWLLVGAAAGFLLQRAGRDAHS